MGNRYMRENIHTPYVNVTQLEFGFRTNGASNPAIFLSNSGGAYNVGATLAPFITSITRTGTGLYLITFADSYPNLVGAWADCMGLITSSAKITAVNNVGTSSPVTANLTTLTSSAAADIASGAQNIVWCGFTFVNSWSQ